MVAIGAASAPPAQAQDQAANDEQPATPPKVGETAPDFELHELEGASVALSKLAANGPVVLVQLRGYPGYQCPFCTSMPSCWKNTLTCVVVCGHKDDWRQWTGFGVREDWSCSWRLWMAGL